METLLEMEIAKTNLSRKVKTALEKGAVLLVGDIEKRTLGDVKKIKGLGMVGLAELTLFIRDNKLKLKKGERDEEAPLKKGLIDKFLKDSSSCNKNQEFSVAGKLLKKYPDKEFWDKFNISFKLNSLCFFLSQKGKEILEKAYYAPKVQNKIQTQKVIISTCKTGEDLIVEKPKSIQDFFND